MASLKLVPMLLVCLQAACAQVQWSELTGTSQDGQSGRVEIAMDNSVMIVVVHHKDDAGNFRQTSNLHHFDSHLVAIKDDQDKTCFVQTFNTSHDEMKHRVEEAKLHHNNIGALKKVWIDSRNLQEFDSETVRRLFGAEIADYCRLYRVVFVDSNHSGLVGDESALPVRKRRFAMRSPGGSARTRVIEFEDTDGGKGGGIINIIRVC